MFKHVCNHFVTPDYHPIDYNYNRLFEMCAVKLGFLEKTVALIWHCGLLLFAGNAFLGIRGYRYETPLVSQIDVFEGFFFCIISEAKFPIGVPYQKNSRACGARLYNMYTLFTYTIRPFCAPQTEIFAKFALKTYIF